MSKRWIHERKRDGYYKQAKREGYRSRSAFKLIQINKRYDVISKGDCVIDLGCAPGGWLQVAQELVGLDGKVLGVDIQKIDALEGINFVRGDITDSKTIERIISEINKADVVLSDMSPNITGHYSMDHARSVGLAERALEVTKKTLKPRGNFVVKVFEGDLFKDYFDRIKSSFEFTKAHSPRASRKQSSEIYVIAKGFRQQ
jgi:23S rRNA (uridine2552-2'-O)-methyltransferase